MSDLSGDSPTADIIPLPTAANAAPFVPAASPSVVPPSEHVFLQDPFWLTNYASAVEGCPVITRAGVDLPSGVNAEQVIAEAAGLGVTIVRR